MNSEPFGIDQKHLFNQMCLSRVHCKLKMYCLFGSVDLVKVVVVVVICFALYFALSVCSLEVFFEIHVASNYCGLLCPSRYS